MRRHLALPGKMVVESSAEWPKDDGLSVNMKPQALSGREGTAKSVPGGILSVHSFRWGWNHIGGGVRLMPLWKQFFSPKVEDEICTEEHDDKSDSCKQHDEREVPVIGLRRVAG
jgi:hypothetical protein